MGQSSTKLSEVGITRDSWVFAAIVNQFYAEQTLFGSSTRNVRSHDHFVPQTRDLNLKGAESKVTDEWDVTRMQNVNDLVTDAI